MRSVCVAWRFAALVGFIKAGVRDLFADLIHHGVDLAPHHQIVGAPRRHAAQMRQHNASDLVNQFIDMVCAPVRAASRQCGCAAALPSLLHARRQPHCAAIAAALAASIAGRQCGSVSGKPSPCRWITPSGFEVADVGPGAIEVPRQYRHADGRWRGGPPSRGRPVGDERTRNGCSCRALAAGSAWCMPRRVAGSGSGGAKCCVEFSSKRH